LYFVQRQQQQRLGASPATKESRARNDEERRNTATVNGEKDAGEQHAPSSTPHPHPSASHRSYNAVGADILRRAPAQAPKPQRAAAARTLTAEIHLNRHTADNSTDIPTDRHHALMRPGMVSAEIPRSPSRGAQRASAAQAVASLQKSLVTSDMM
tara:strand:+ start:39 stop:503 length:465 start_codon:yes stop_codon:yes gene_type:complete